MFEKPVNVMIVDYTETILKTLEEIGGEPAGPEVR